MCGYARRHIGGKELREFVNLIGMPDLFKDHPDEVLLQHFYPAFGGAASRQINELIIRENGEVKTVDATWWFDCKEVDGELIVNNHQTTFNARNLASPYWKGAIRHHRAVVLATALGEGKEVNGKNRHYFMEGESPILLGAVYRSFPNGLYSTAIITRDAHPRLEQFHDKACPLFLPPDPDFLKLWLGDEPETNPAIANLLDAPKVFGWLKVKPVKTFKDAVATGSTETLISDLAYSAREKIIKSILKWLPLSEQLINSLSKNEFLVVIRWKPISGDTVVTDIHLGPELIKTIERSLEKNEPEQMERYLEKVEDYVVMMAESFEGHDARPWDLSAEILEG